MKNIMETFSQQQYVTVSRENVYYSFWIEYLCLKDLLLLNMH